MKFGTRARKEFFKNFLYAEFFHFFERPYFHIPGGQKSLLNRKTRPIEKNCEDPVIEIGKAVK